MPFMGGSFVPVSPTVIKDSDSQNNSHVSPPGQVLVDISNRNGTTYSDNKNSISETRFGRNSSVSPFKRPRSSKFSTPLKRNSAMAPSGDSLDYFFCLLSFHFRLPFHSVQ